MKSKTSLAMNGVKIFIAKRTINFYLLFSSSRFIVKLVGFIFFFGMMHSQVNFAHFPAFRRLHDISVVPCMQNYRTWSSIYPRLSGFISSGEHKCLLFISKMFVLLPKLKTIVYGALVQIIYTSKSVQRLVNISVDALFASTISAL